VLDAGGHTANITSLFFARGDKQLISAAADGTVRIWDVATGDTARVLRLPIRPDDRAGPGGGSLALAGRAPTGDQHRVYLYDLAANRVVRTLEDHPVSIGCVDFSRDGKWLVSGDAGGTIRVWNAATGALAHKLTGHRNGVRALAFSPDGAKLASGGWDGTLRLWSVTDGSGEVMARHPEEVSSSLAWSPDGKVLASAGRRPYVRLWGADGTPLGRAARRSTGEGLAFSADGGLLLAGGSLIEVAEKKELFCLKTPAGMARAAALSADGNLAAVGSTGTGLYLWETHTGRVVHRLGGRGRAIQDVAWSPDGQTLGWEQRRHLGEWKVQAATFHLGRLKYGPPPDADFETAQPSLGDLSLEKAGPHRLAVRRGGETVRELELPDGPGGITCFTFLNEKQAVVGQNTGLYLYDVSTGRRLRTYKGAGAVRAVAAAPDKDYFVAGGSDEVLRVYTADHDMPLVLLYVAGDDWVAWTPDGYYAASPGGERLVGWQVDSGSEQLPAFYAAAQFRPSLYRPDVIRRLLQTRDVARARELADRERHQKSEATDVQHVLPPAVAVTSVEQVPAPAAPPASAEGTYLLVDGPTVKVKAAARRVGKHAVTDLQLLLEGRPYDGGHGGSAAPAPDSGGLAREWTVQLTPGAHRISALARSAVSSATSSAVEVLYRPATPPDPKDLRPSLYVLCIGINAYPGDLALQYAAADARELSRTLADRSRPLFREVKTDLLVDGQATRAAILARLAGLKKQMKPHDVAVIFYAGHGHRDDMGRFYLLSCDMDPDDLDHTTVTGEELKKCLADLPGRVLLLLDACHAGAIGGRVKGARPLTDDLARELADDDCGVIVMCAAMGGEESQENGVQRHGLFTQALIEGLSGAADYNKDGLIQLTELDLYVDNRVAQLSKDEQHPVTAKPTTVRSFALARLKE
jgi:WD40 repeat protein